MMTGDRLARQFDERPGYHVVDFEEVGLPVYRIVSTVLTLQPKAYSPIEEFVLRSVELGLSDIDDIAAFLGINRKIVESSASLLVKEDDVVVQPSGQLRLTVKSERVLRGEQLIRPREQSLVFWFDGLTRKPIRNSDFRFVQPSYLKDRGIREIRPFPAKKPTPDDIKGDELQRVLRTSSTPQETQILQVKSIGKAYVFFIPAFALIYRSKATDDVQVGFAIDERLSEVHEAAFAASDGATRLGIKAAILRPERIRDASGLNLPIGPAVEKLEASKKKREQAIKRFKERGTPSALPSPQGGEGKVEMVAVYDHAPLLQEALTTAAKRLIIISPWITDAVVDAKFIAQLRRLLDRGVQVHIGYGLGEDVGRPPKAIAELEKLEREKTNFSLVRLGDTHAKILIKDTDWLVTTSFNWLSFKGDPRRTFREEWGAKVAIPDQVAEYSEKLLKRLQGAASRK